MAKAIVSGQSTIYVIGTGAIGKTLAVFLKLAGRRVILVRASVDDGSMETKHFRIESDSLYEADVEAATLSAIDSLGGIVVLANKSYGNEQLASILKTKTGTSPIVLLQNGLGIEKPFLRNDFPEVYRCVLFVTAQSLDATSVRFKPVAISPIGVEKGNDDRLNHIVQQINSLQFRFNSETDIQRVIWKKAIVNSVFNSVCPLLQVDNGIFYRNETAFQMAREVIAECSAVAKLQGILLSPDEVEASLLKISKMSDGQLISTLQDIQNNRATEIDTLNFQILRVAADHHKADMVHATGLLGRLVKLKADINRQKNR